LNKEYHQKCYNGRAGVDNQLPSVGIMKERPGDSPDQNGQGRQHENAGTARGAGHGIGDLAEGT
jgi:hypothetical protein